MKNIIYIYLRKIIISFLIINGFNFICGNLLVYIPINVFNVLFVALLGIPGIITMNILYFII